MAYERKVERGQSFQIRKFKDPELNRAIHVFGTHKMNQLSNEELFKYGSKIINEARTRKSLITRNKLRTASPAYQFLEKSGIRFSLKNKTRKEAQAIILEAYNFLHTPTSTVQGALSYKDWLDSHLGNTTESQREKIWDVVHRFESTHTGQFINFNYDMTIRKIAEATIKNDFDVDRATAELEELLGKHGNLREIDIDFDDKIAYFPGNR